MNAGESEPSAYSVRIEKGVQNGLTLTHVDGQTVFVHGALPGETVRIRIVKERSQHKFGICEEVIEPASNRVSPDCPVFPQCGGCSFRHISYDEELQLKLDLLHEHKFIAPALGDLKVHTGPRNHYRNQVWLHASEAGPGFFALHTNDVVPLPSAGCLNLSKSLNFRIASEKELEFRDYLTEQAAKRKEADAIPLPGLDFSWRMAATGFSQANRFLIPDWLDSIYLMSQPFLATSGEKVSSVYELFCGSGLIGGHLILRSGQRVDGKSIQYFGAESSGPSLEKGKSNFRAAGIKARLINADLYRGNIAQHLNRQLPAPDQNSLIVANPPRAGLKENLAQWIVQSKSTVLVYSSCNPQTLNRDLGILERGGFQMKELHWFDFFPGTPHSELVTLLERA